jgi:hypothetical protein
MNTCVDRHGDLRKELKFTQCKKEVNKAFGYNDWWNYTGINSALYV